MTIAAKVLSRACMVSTSEPITRIARRDGAQFDVGAQLLRIPQNESKQVSCGIQMKDLVLRDDVWGHDLVHCATVLAPSLAVVHQRKEPVIPDPRKHVSTQRRHEWVSLIYVQLCHHQFRAVGVVCRPLVQ